MFEGNRVSIVNSVSNVSIVSLEQVKASWVTILLKSSIIDV